MASNGEPSNNAYSRSIITIDGIQHEMLIRRLAIPTSASADLHGVPITNVNANHPNVNNAYSRSVITIDGIEHEILIRRLATPTSASANLHGVPITNVNVNHPNVASTSGNAHNSEGQAGPSGNVNMTDVPSSSTMPPPFVGLEPSGGRRKRPFHDDPQVLADMLRISTGYINPSGASEEHTGERQHSIPKPVPITEVGKMIVTKDNLPHEERKKGWIIIYRDVKRTAGNKEDVFYFHCRSKKEFRTWPEVIAYINNNTLPVHHKPGELRLRREKSQNKITLFVVGYFNTEDWMYLRKRERIQIQKNSRKGRKEQADADDVPKPSFTHLLFDFEPHDPPTVA